MSGLPPAAEAEAAARRGVNRVKSRRETRGARPRAQRNIIPNCITHPRLTYLPYLLARRGRTSPSLFDWSLLQFFAYS